MLRLKEVIISITNRCNLKCKMCDIPVNLMEELDTFQWKQVIEEASLIGAETIVFSGGEPLLREDIFELITAAKDNRMNACLTSNGYLLDEKAAGKLAASGVNVVNVSLEGPEEIHNYLRGQGTFKRAVKALENLRKYGVESTIAVMVSKHNYNSMPYIVELAKKYGASTIRFQPFSVIFMDNESLKSSFFINKKQIKKVEAIFEKVIELSKKYKISTNPTNYLRAIPFYLSGKKIAFRNGCNALWTSCPINACGDIFPCWAIIDKKKQIGNVGKNSFFELWYSREHSGIRELIVDEGCRSCMMSCYDGVFGQNREEKYFLNLFRKIKNISAQKLIDKLTRYLRKRTVQLKLRCKFYNSYRGSFRNIFNRIFKNVQRKMSVRNINNKGQIEKSLEEISLLKKRLNKEIAKLK
ncbi:MAG: radical SAM protein [Candidatus Omnitrophota bacterium]